MANINTKRWQRLLRKNSVAKNKFGVEVHMPVGRVDSASLRRKAAKKFYLFEQINSEG